MKSVFGFWIACAAVTAAAQCFAAEPVTRVKARLTAFDGQVMALEPLPPVAKDQATSLTISVLPDTRYVGSDRMLFGALKPGDYAVTSLGILLDEVVAWANALAPLRA